MPRRGMLAAGEVLRNTTVWYTAILRDPRPLRVWDIPQPIGADCAPEVRRDMGDIVEAERAGTVGLLPGLTLTPLSPSLHTFEEQCRGDRGVTSRQRRAETDGDAQSLEGR